MADSKTPIIVLSCPKRKKLIMVATVMILKSTQVLYIPTWVMFARTIFSPPNFSLGDCFYYEFFLPETRKTALGHFHLIALNCVRKE